MLPDPRAKTACSACLARSRLLHLLSARLEHAARDLPSLITLLELDDRQLIEAIGGRRKQELRERHEAALEQNRRAVHPESSICPHSPRSQQLPSILHVLGESERLARAIDQPLVGILGARQASEYGRHVASELASQLACAGITVGAPFAEGVAAAALAGSLAGGGAPLAIVAGGLDTCQPSHLSGLKRRLSRDGCLVSELPAGARERRWSRRAGGRILVALAQLLLVVEARLDGPELELASLAKDQGKLVVAVPGRIGSAGAQGPHALLRDGAPLVASAQDVLDLLYGVGEMLVPARSAKLEPRLRTVLERVAAGEDTLDRLIAGQDAAGTLLAVGELEAVGLIKRSAAGRYFAQL